MNDYLMHYGVIGMKWGVRRYQNPDGTRTAAGKKKERKEYRITQKKEGYNISPRRVKKNMNNMTDKELRTALDRIGMQRQVRQANPSAVERGKNRLDKYLAATALITGTAFAIKNYPEVVNAGKEIVKAAANSDVRWIAQGLLNKL